MNKDEHCLYPDCEEPVFVDIFLTAHELYKPAGNPIFGLCKKHYYQALKNGEADKARAAKQCEKKGVMK